VSRGDHQAGKHSAVARVEISNPCVPFAALEGIGAQRFPNGQTLNWRPTKAVVRVIPCITSRCDRRVSEPLSVHVAGPAKGHASVPF